MRNLQLLDTRWAALVLVLLVAGTSPVMAAENLVKNPGFENWTGDSPDGWTPADGAIQKAEGNDVHSGSYALILGDFNNNVRVYQDVRVVPRRMYRFSSWQKYPGPSSSTQVSIVWMDEARKAMSSWNKNTFDNSQFFLEYKLFSYDSLTAPPGSAFARIEFIKPGWGLLYADDVAFTTMPMAPVVDFTLPPQVRAGQTVEFASGSFVPDGGNITSTVWNFCGAQDLPGTRVTYTFPPGGARDCQVKLTVTSSDGLTNTTTKLVTLEGSSPPGGGPSAAPPSEGTSYGDTPPVASFSPQPVPAKDPLTVSFDGKASYDPDGNIVSYSWDFGDGLRPGPSVSEYKFSRPGTYQVTLSVKDNGGAINTYTKTVVVASQYLPKPLFSADPVTGPPPLPVKLDGSASYDPDGTITAYRWDFGDGSPMVSDIITSHTFTREGTYLVTLTVTDNGGLTNYLTKAIFVGKISPPVAVFTARYLSDAPAHTMSFDASESQKPGGNITTYLWEFGDNSAPAAGITITHQYLNTGTYRVNLTVVDNAGLSNTVIKSVEVQPAINVTLVMAAVLVIAVVGGILFFLWWNRKLQLIPQQAAVPANGTSVIPLRVQFINFFKQEKKMGKDTEVKLAATSGTVQHVTVLKGQSRADAKLTSSLECGSVTVTGESDGKKAECTVEFTCTDAALELTLKPAEIPADGKSVAQISIRAKDPSGNYLTFLKDRTVELTPTAGTIAGPVIIPAKAPAVGATITSEKKPGAVTITAASPPLKGEVKMTFVELEKRFCMHCGTQMELEEKKCPKCGKIPPSGVDVKQCPACNTLIPASALYCASCGARQAGKDEKGEKGKA